MEIKVHNAVLAGGKPGIGEKLIKSLQKAVSRWELSVRSGWIDEFPRIYFESFWQEAKEWEKIKSQIETLDQIENHVGTWFSKDEVYKKVRKLSDDEIKELKKQLKKEKAEEDSDEDASPTDDFDYNPKEEGEK